MSSYVSINVAPDHYSQPRTLNEDLEFVWDQFKYRELNQVTVDMYNSELQRINQIHDTKFFVFMNGNKGGLTMTFDGISELEIELFNSDVDLYEKYMHSRLPIETFMEINRGKIKMKKFEI